MAGSPSQSGNQDGGEKPSTTGEKHQTEHETPDAKRPRTEKQTTLDDAVTKLDEKDGDDSNNKKDEGDKQQEEQVAAGSEEKADTKDDNAIKPGEEPDVPSNILEKGIIYFFFRGRVGIDQPSEVDDIARTHLLLRPIDTDAKLGEGAIPDAGNTRLLALPKKVLPRSGKDRFMVFVEKSGAHYDEIKKDFLTGSDYQTKTAGPRHIPAATPVGEGVYVITSTGRESHLAYIITLPEELGEVQKDLGLKEKGSFILSTKNPEHPGPANAQLPEGPKFSKEIMEEFRSLRWLPTQPKHLDYVNTQFLLIGESSGTHKALEPQKEDLENGKDAPGSILDSLGEADIDRMDDLAGTESEAIFADLHARAKDYPKLKTTF